MLALTVAACSGSDDPKDPNDPTDPGPDPTDEDDPPTPEETAPPVIIDLEAPAERPKKVRKKRSEGQRASGAKADAGAAAPKTEKDLLLDSVLSALPEPKAPGQGRGRRRVTTAALSGTPVSATPTDGEANGS